jgi:hypothetical protein
MREYILTPRPGFTVEEAIENTNNENACIIEYEYGVYQHMYPAIPITMQMFRPKPHPSYMRKTHIVLREGEKVLKKTIPENMLSTGVNPFFQVIQRIVTTLDGTQLESIQRSLLYEYLWFPDTSREKRVIELIVKSMHDDGLLVRIKTKKLEIYKVGIEIEVGQRLVDLVRGYDPFEYQIMDLISGHGSVSNNEIHDYILEGLQWTKNDRLIEDYLYRLRQKGCITKIGDWYRFRNALEPFGKSTKKTPVDVELRKKESVGLE